MAARWVAARYSAFTSGLAVALVGFALAQGEAQAAETDLSLKRVLLSSGGVGYFEFAAEVTGPTDLSLQVPLNQVDDVLKSIVVFDETGAPGQVSLPGREPLAQIFRDLPFGPGALSSPDVLLNHLQGAEITARGGRELQGRVLRVVAESVLLPNGTVASTRHRVTLVTAAGLQQFVLEEVESVEFVDPELKAQVSEALAAIADNRVQDRRNLKILSSGDGTREIRVGYVVAAPLWKASYRAALGKSSSDGTVGLQGWAHVDNLSGHDWDQVDLTLVSGNPVTFRQALYSAYFVDRPEVPVEVLGRILPRLDQGALVASRTEEQPEGGEAGNEDFRRAQKKAVSGLAMEAEALAPAPSMADQSSIAFQMRPSDPNRLLAAATDDAATQVAFRIPRPVSVAKGEALMVPIIDRDLPGERLSLYQPRTHNRHPLASLELTNDSASGLPPGSLTLYEQSAESDTTYLGDARLAGLPIGEERLISFALDQKTTVDREIQQSQHIAKGKINKGILELTYTVRQTTQYLIKAPAEEARVLLIEQPRMPGWKLVSPKPEDTSLTESDYRIEAKLAAGGEQKLDVVLEQPQFQTIQLSSLTSRQLVSYSENGELDEKLRQAIAKIGDLRQAIEQLDRQLAALANDRERMFQDQKRIRDNMNRVPKDSDLYRRYLTKLDQQEDTLEALLVKLDETQEARSTAEDQLVDYVGTLTL